MKPRRFQKKPVVVEAVRWDGTTHDAMEIVKWVQENGGQAQLVSMAITHSISITTLEGEMCALEGWWIIRGVEGEFYPCKDPIFEQTYVSVSRG